MLLNLCNIFICDTIDSFRREHWSLLTAPLKERFVTINGCFTPFTGNCWTGG
ncbi:hypothetical protein SAMN04487894_104260 [Niabella drilacis]|uniref:Uncharacterized protein n=1 Tax=Niabella drilacis (strain DSM 25811 / CCM 8410 / CCUG 62505 / LMG 26954 / E90) TaxID=1285928 RepID=A0A1G6Q4C5_NIADE|nr:hypothetical protein SAMN04487894_104260 [Niabella drilacis]